MSISRCIIHGFWWNFAFTVLGWLSSTYNFFYDPWPLTYFQGQIFLKMLTSAFHFIMHGFWLNFALSPLIYYRWLSSIWKNPFIMLLDIWPTSQFSIIICKICTYIILYQLCYFFILNFFFSNGCPRFNNREWTS